MGSEFSGLLFFSFARRKRASFIFFSSLVDFCVMSYTSLEKWRLTKSEFSQLDVFNRESSDASEASNNVDAAPHQMRRRSMMNFPVFSRGRKMSLAVRKEREEGEMCQRCRRRDRREI